VRVRLETGTHRKFWDFLRTLGQQGRPQYLAWLSLLVEAVHDLEERRLSPEVQAERRAVLELTLQRRNPTFWLEERIRHALGVLTGENR
jgi:hypothetical protein